MYYVIGGSGIVEALTEANDCYDEDFWKIYNYFRTKEQAEKAAEAVKEALRKLHEENE